MKELTLEATVENIQVVTDFVNEELEALHCPMKAQMQIDVAIDELFSNIAFYAYQPESGNATIQVEVEKEPLAIILTFIDHGIPYNPLDKKEPDISLPAEDRPVGGLGIFLIKKMMDEVTYKYQDGQNIIQMKKML